MNTAGPFRLETQPAEMVSARQFRERLGIGAAYFAELVRTGKLPAPSLQLGRSRLWHPDVANYYIDQRRRRHSS